MDQLEKLQAAIGRLVGHTRTLFYQLVLLAHDCPHCGGSLVMLHEGRCRCTTCGKAMDLTVTFQRCPGCGGRVALHVRRYACRKCGQDIPSHFLFDGKVFNAEYFRQKMAEARQRKQQRETQQHEQAAGQVYRSPAVEPGPIEMPSSPGLIDVLNQLVGADAPDPKLLQVAEEAFNLQRYEQHVMAVLNRLPEGDEVTLQWILPVAGDDRLERVRLFIALIFLAHAGLIELRQGHDNTIWVSQRETQRERSTLSADAQAADA